MADDPGIICSTISIQSFPDHPESFFFTKRDRDEESAQKFEDHYRKEYGRCQKPLAG